MVNAKVEDEDFEVCIEDMQSLQWLIQHLQIVKHNLEENFDTINGLLRYANTLKPRQHSSKDSHCVEGSAYYEFSTWVSAWKDETRSNLKTLNTLMGQIRECNNLVSYNSASSKKPSIPNIHA